jgi:hypothetical protein
MAVAEIGYNSAVRRQIFGGVGAMGFSAAQGLNLPNSPNIMSYV